MTTSHVHRALTRALDGQETARVQLDVQTTHRFIIFSDQHKGARDGADEFRICEPAYRAALQYYLEDGWTLVLLGDAEELWEQSFAEVERAYRSTLELEGSFPADRYYRVWGNHDDSWMVPALVRRHLVPYMPADRVHEGIRMDVCSGKASLGTLLMVHGHQGRFGSDRIRPVARVAVRFWRPIQRLFGVGVTTPATDACYRAEHDREMYEWAARRPRTILLAGHTHRPVWSSTTHLQKLKADLAETRATSPADPGRLVELEAAIRARRALFGHNAAFQQNRSWLH